jgi:hypothetical protein
MIVRSSIGIREDARGMPPRALKARIASVKLLSQARCRLDAHDGRDARRLEVPPGITEEGLDRGYVEAAADLVRPRDRKVLAGGGEEAALLELILERFALGFGAFKHGVGVADRVGKRFVRKVVESAIGRRSLGHGSSPWLGLGPSGKFAASPRLAFTVKP